MPELYKRYRPKSLDRIVGNASTVQSIRAMVDKKALPHALLFTGPSGCGKTSLARILKEELFCHDMDFIEMNSASYRGIESIRDIQRLMNLAPGAGDVRIWLLDEVHKLSGDAQAAMLKILEDTPTHVWFFLCTTDPQKLIKPILTRCTEFQVKSLTEDEQTSLCQRVCKKEGIGLSDEVRDSLITSAQGSARMLLVLLEQIACLPPEQQKEAIESKLASENVAYDLCKALIAKTPWKKVSAILKNLKEDPEEIRYSVLGFARAVLLREGGWDAYNVIKSFERNFYDSKQAGLAAACYEALNVKE